VTVDVCTGVITVVVAAGVIVGTAAVVVGAADEVVGTADEVVGAAEVGHGVEAEAVGRGWWPRWSEPWSP
jgi:hypothetical protein